MSWNLVDTVVLDVDSDRGRVVIKAAGPEDHHFGREITAYQGFIDCLARTGHAAQLLHQDQDANLLVIRYLDGSLVEGPPRTITARLSETGVFRVTRRDPPGGAECIQVRGLQH